MSKHWREMRESAKHRHRLASLRYPIFNLLLLFELLLSIYGSFLVLQVNFWSIPWWISCQKFFYLLIFSTKKLSVRRNFEHGKLDIHQVLSITLSFREFHSVHSFASVPMQESPTLVHSRELAEGFEMHYFQGQSIEDTWTRLRLNNSWIQVEFADKSQIAAGGSEAQNKAWPKRCPESTLSTS